MLYKIKSLYVPIILTHLQNSLCSFDTVNKNSIDQLQLKSDSDFDIKKNITDGEKNSYNVSNDTYFHTKRAAKILHVILL